MKLLLDRKYKLKDYTIGNLYVDDAWFCNVLEDTDRGLTQDMPIDYIYKVKVPSKTAIPKGTYNIAMDIYSPSFGNKTYYKNLCNGRVPRLQNVPAFSGVLIHCGNTANDSSGCLLVGLNKEKGKVLNSQATFTRLYKKMKGAYDRKENITITIL